MNEQVNFVPMANRDTVDFGRRVLLLIPSFLVFLDDILGFLSTRQKDGLPGSHSPLHKRNRARSLGRKGVFVCHDRAQSRLSVSICLFSFFLFLFLFSFIHFFS
ncbi:hypothetical protein H0G86_005335 [Trichoderma simmonsii]|uniref:Transmembrane protein n=1 Tax=Trichoderma simmonsii TaxID=1491479 RepID=A0A8G0LEH9_9HYPO|nr:hypothetical protein H0G86_005335 [Trichoderma simmonsii]